MNAAVPNILAYRPRRAGQRGDSEVSGPLTEAQEVVPQLLAAARPSAEGAQAVAGTLFQNHHIYGGKAASTWSTDTSRAGLHTVRIEAAGSVGTRQYDWQRKISVQLSEREMVLVLAVLMGWLTKFEGKGHGEGGSKWFSLERQEDCVFLLLRAKGQPAHGIPILPGDGFRAKAMLIEQMLKNSPFLNASLLLSLVRNDAQLAS